MGSIEVMLRKRKDLIDRRLNVILPKEETRPKRLHKAMRYSVFSGGKRIRPILMIESYIACGGRIKDVLDAACAVELVHTFSLIHDDLPSMDDDDYRRGELTCHKKFDEATAVLAGDSLLALAFNLIARHKNARIAVALIEELSRSIGSLGMAGGQCVDIEYEGRKKDKDVLNYINLNKTAIFIKAALKMGAQAAGAGSKKIEAMARFGRYIGEAFQIIDDILDNGDSVRVFGKEAADKKARILTKSAQANLKIFSNKADKLKSISNYLVKRNF